MLREGCCFDFFVKAVWFRVLCFTDEPETRDAWWEEIRQEIKSHAKALGCHAVVGYSESTSIWYVINYSTQGEILPFHTFVLPFLLLHQDLMDQFMIRLSCPVLLFPFSLSCSVHPPTTQRGGVYPVSIRHSSHPQPSVYAWRLPRHWDRWPQVVLIKRLSKLIVKPLDG